MMIMMMIMMMTMTMMMMTMYMMITISEDWGRYDNGDCTIADGFRHGSFIYDVVPDDENTLDDDES